MRNSMAPGNDETGGSLSMTPIAHTLEGRIGRSDRAGESMGLRSQRSPARGIPHWISTGYIIALNCKSSSPAHARQTHQLGVKHGIGRLDLVENRYVDEIPRLLRDPGGTISRRAPVP